MKITATCIRVPVMRAHAESINLEFEKDISGERWHLFSSCSDWCQAWCAVHQPQT